MRFIPLAILLLGQGAGFAPFDVAALAIAPPIVITELDRSLLHGAPSRLSWSSDGADLYVQSRDGVGDAARARHFQIRLGSKAAVSELDGEPAWAAEYWHGKVGEAAPGLPWLVIDVNVDRQRTRIAPFTGGFASAGGATGIEAASTVTLSVVSLSYVGVEIGRWNTDERKSGATFGWGPPGSGALAFADSKGHLTLLDKEGHQRLVPRTDGVILPAWSPDGNYVAFIKKQGRSSYTLASVALLRVDTPLQ